MTQLTSRQLLLANAAILGQALTAAGIASIYIRYQGSGDEGHIEECSALDENDQGFDDESADEVEVALLRPSGELDESTDVISAAEALYELTMEEAGHSAYQDADGGYGEWHIYANGRVVLDHSDYVTETVDSFHEFGPDEPSAGPTDAPAPQAETA